MLVCYFVRGNKTSLEVILTLKDGLQRQGEMVGDHTGGLAVSGALTVAADLLT